jgi:hypothetical protein
MTKEEKLVKALDGLAWQAARKEDQLSADPFMYVFTPLFAHAVAFWRELRTAVECGWSLTPDQKYAAEVVAAGALRGGPKR